MQSQNSIIILLHISLPASFPPELFSVSEIFVENIRAVARAASVLEEGELCLWS